MKHIKLLAFAVAALLLATLPARAHAATPCEQLTGLALPHATVTAAAIMPAGAGRACKISVTSRPTADSDIRIEVWIPAGDAWNGRYVQLGNGGFAGSIRSSGLAGLAALGYAVAMTDDGHQSAIGTDASWAIRHPEKVVDFGWRALKETTVDAKALIRAYRGAPPKYAYFNGCSDGGREALIEAQRFPDDFDGIVAGAPAYNFSGLLTLGAYDMQALHAPGGYLTPDKLKVLETAALADCGGGRYIADPLACHFDPKSAACPGGQDQPGCLSAAQVATARALYRGLVSANGKLLYPGYSPGGEAESGGWGVWVTGASLAQNDNALIHGFASGFWGGFVFGDPNYDILKLDIATAPGRAAKVAAIVDSTDPNLAPFRAHGGKLIQYHGWNDAAIPPRGSIVYYEDVRARMGDVGGFYRLYLIPGMLHCGGGQGPGGVAWLGLIQDWVEAGKPPHDVVAKSATGQQTLHPYAHPGS
jgi:feruloyl esterase